MASCCKGWRPFWTVWSGVPHLSSRTTFVPSPPDVQTLVHVEQRTVRSGEKVAAEGHLIVIGDVNPGAEVIAGYNIFVWGALRGSAYAGVPDHEEAIITALHFAPIQLRIAGILPDRQRHDPMPWDARVGAYRPERYCGRGVGTGAGGFYKRG